ncbi:MAG: hypothetical protein ACK5C0_14665 [Candidatus Kapaibacterium sp.]|mgnify:FL=1|jgi:septal ring factor EnvC (AmiA/AmiB activator)|nr:hypothetical protein [Candidatus Kapabacteria bacterium]
MDKQLLRFNRVIAILSFSVLVTFVGCTPKITEEQLAKLRELRTESARLETEIKKQEADKAKIDRELASRQKDLKDCEDKRNFVNQKLSQWPNVWE